MSALTVVILTLNEEQHLPDCLASLRPLACPVVVVDAGSTDATTDIADAAGATVLAHAFDGFADQRNWALEHAAQTAWVLFIDADERLTPAGCAEIAQALDMAEMTGVSLGWFPRRNVLFGREFRGGGWWPDYQARLLRRGTAHYVVAREVHEIAVGSGADCYFREPLVHLNYATRSEFVNKQRAYTARRMRYDPERPRRRRLLGAPLHELRRRLLLHHGYRDGRDGLFVAGVLAREELRAMRALRRAGTGHDATVTAGPGNDAPQHDPSRPAGS